MMVKTKINQSKNWVNDVGFGKLFSCSDLDVKKGKLLNSHMNSIESRMQWTTREGKI